MAKVASDLSDRQLRFVAEYAVDGNGTQAAIRAGYSPNGADVTAHRLLGDPRIQEALAAAKAKLQVRTDITVDRLLRELALLAFSDVRYFIVDDDGTLHLREGAPDEAWRAVSSVKHRITTTKSGDSYREVELRLWSKTAAIELAGRHYGAFPQRHEVVEKPTDKLTPEQLERVAAGEALELVLREGKASEPINREVN